MKREMADANDDRSPPADHAVDHAASRDAAGVEAARRWMARAAVAGATACAFALSLAFATRVLATFSGRVQLAASLLVLAFAIVLLVALGALAREMFFWRRSLRRLARLVNELRAGEATMHELDLVVGGSATLVEPIRSILLDLREQKRVNAELKEEMRQRIFNRTDALERQLGAMKAQASRDALTGLNNRRAFDAMAPQVFAACKASREDLCVLMIDVDNFKPLNDTLGHAAGDEMLKGIAEIVRSSVREHDSAYRIGGDEFVVLLPRSSRAMGERLGERLASLVDHLARPLRLPHQPGLSIGVASLSEDESGEAKDLLARADRRLYDLKSAKPNRSKRSVA